MSTAQPAFRTGPVTNDEADNDDVTIDLQTGSEVEPELEIVDDTPEDDRGRTPLTEQPVDPTEEELASYSQDVKKRFKHFTKGYHDQRRAAEAAQRERDEALRVAQQVVEENRRLKSTLDSGQNAFLNQTLQVVDKEIEDAKAELKQAHDDFDTDRIAEAQSKMMDATIRRNQLKNVQQRAIQRPENGVQPAPQAAQGPDPKALAWQEANQWFGKDSVMTGLAMGVHQELIAAGVDPQSDTYYARLNDRVRRTFPDKFEADPGAPTPPRRQSVVAAPTRSVAPRKITLTRSQLAVAEKLGVSPKEYALEVAKLMRTQNA
jgi:hypothetical protein